MQTLIIPGLEVPDFKEIYYLYRVEDDVVEAIRVDPSCERLELRGEFERSNSADGRFYGVTDMTALVNFFAHPHSVVPIDDGFIVSYRQAHFFRKVTDHGLVRTFKPNNEREVRVLLSATNDLQGDRFSFVSLDWAVLSRAADAPVPARLQTVDIRDGKTIQDRPLANFAREAVHQLATLSSGWSVAIDMCMSIDRVEGAPYFTSPFPVGEVVFSHSDHGDIVWNPGIPAAGHVEVDPVHEDVVYLSCHNISKRESDIGIHGPGALMRIPVKETGPVFDDIKVFSDSEFYRLTSHRTFSYEGRSLIAVTAYPNKVYIIDCESMTRLREIVLFDAPGYEGGSFCPKSGKAPLSLSIDGAGRFLYLSNSEEIFIVDVRNGFVSTRAFATPGTFIPTAHSGVR